jgi:hypothetical protein
MYALIGKFKNLFKDFKSIETKPGSKSAEKAQLKEGLIIGMSDISRAIREANRIQARKRSRRYIFF